MANSIVETIGATPMVELQRIPKDHGLNGRVLVKCEYLNPGFSKKDRIALEMLREATSQGQLLPGQTVVELTSGNTGTGLAMTCRAMGHPFVAVMSCGNTAERARMMRALGAEVILVDQAPGSLPNQVSGDDLDLVEQAAQRITYERGAYRCDQFKLAGNILAHQRHTGPEIWEQSRGTVTAFVDFAGTGGSFTGVMRYLLSKNPDIRGYVVEPAGAPALAGQTITQQSHKIQGGGYSKPSLPLLDPDLVHDYLQVTDDEAVASTHLLARDEGIFGGFSSGANLAGALQLLASEENGQTIALLACDSGLKYMSTDLYA
ncbi:MAG: cysteine synthase family protein [Akkermansiaceae bacterium]|nr:cysteine synthase family protein [Akkermansiaceae bacterium]